MWHGQVKFAPGGAYAYRPHEVLAHPGLREAIDGFRQRRDLSSFAATDGKQASIGREEGERGNADRYTNVAEPIEFVAALREDGIPAQVNHVLFASCCCPPHPASPGADAVYDSPFFEEAMAGSPVYGSPVYGSPVYGSPVYGSSGGGCGGCGWWTTALAGNPVYGSAVPSPFVLPWLQATGRRRSTARPEQTPAVFQLGEAVDHPAQTVRVAILDTGYAHDFAPTSFGAPAFDPAEHGEEPDSDNDNLLDPAAGHGTFIAGLIERVAPGCQLEVIRVLSPDGAGNEADIGEQLRVLADSEEPPDLVNLSFGGYSPMGMGELAGAIASLSERGTVVVAAAGNDGTCMPTYPAAFDNVVAVAALDHDGSVPVPDDVRAAPFTNYGPWVDACAPGAGIVSTFFEGFDGAETPESPGDPDPDDFHGWAVWSGTSFAAPIVVAHLARLVQAGSSPQQAKDALIDNGPTKGKMLGTLVG